MGEGIPEISDIPDPVRDLVGCPDRVPEGPRDVVELPDPVDGVWSDVRKVHTDVVTDTFLPRYSDPVGTSCQGRGRGGRGTGGTPR